MEQFSGTKTYGFPIIVSALIDDDGSVRGLRVVSDPRFEQHNRDEAYLLRNFLTARFGREGWACEKLAAEDGETPVDGMFVKERCRKEIDERTTASLSARHLRKAGQSPIDPRTGRETTGQFRECGALRAGAGEVERGPRPNITVMPARRGHPVITGQAFVEWSCKTVSTRECGVY